MRPKTHFFLLLIVKNCLRQANWLRARLAGSRLSRARLVRREQEEELVRGEEEELAAVAYLLSSLGESLSHPTMEVVEGRGVGQTPQ